MYLVTVLAGLKENKEIVIGKTEAVINITKRKFPPICPNFVIELLSPSDSLKTTQKKMREYIANVGSAIMIFCLNQDNQD